MATPNEYSSPPGVRISDHRDHREVPRTRKRSPSMESDRKRHRVDGGSPGGYSRSRSYHDRPGWERDGYNNSRIGSSYHTQSKTGASYMGRYQNQYDRNRGAPRGYENGFGSGGSGAAPIYQQRAAMPMHQPNMQQQTAKSRRLYIGNIPFQAGLTDVALTQFFSAMYVAGFRANRPGESLPVVSFWLHSDGKFGFMELRGEQEAVNMMQFNGVFLHGRPLRVNRPSDYRPEVHNPVGMNLVPDTINIQAVMDLCEKLGGVVSAPAQLAAIAASQGVRGNHVQVPTSFPPSVPSQAQPSAVPATMLRSQTPPEDTAKVSAPAALVVQREAEPQEVAPSKSGRVISLRNLVTDEDLNGDDFQGLLEDVESECATYGKVGSVNIPKGGPWKGTAFVEFVDESSVPAAVKALCQRVFDGRQIEATVVSNCETAAQAANRHKPQKSIVSEPISVSKSNPVSKLIPVKKANRVISLRNLFKDEDLNGEDFQDLLDDVKSECATYGKVQSVNIPKNGPWKGAAFVEFVDESAASAAVEALCQRVFDGRQIECIIINDCETAAQAANRPKMS